MNKPYLLIDARNIMYRAIFANQGSGKKRKHHFTVMMTFVHQAVSKFNPGVVGLFWDAKKKTLWRRKIYHSYKDRDASKYRTDISDELIYTESAAKALLKHMGVLQFYKKKQEADDLIYSACRVLAPRETVVVSTDKDLHQLIFRMNHVTLYDHSKDLIVEKPEFDPVIQKALSGDKSDTIDGYFKVGPVKGEKLTRSFDERKEFLDEKGIQTFLRNMLLVDLSLNPHALANDVYVSRKLCDKPKFDRRLILETAKKHNVSGLASEYARTVAPLKNLTD